MVEIIGWVGAICFCLCGLPQAYLSYKQGHSEGVSSGLLWLWGIGEILTLIYILLQNIIEWPLIVNYLVNLVFIAIIFKYKYFPRQIDS